jgi:hypothetical protein
MAYNTGGKTNPLKYAMIESNLELYNVILQQVQFFYKALRLHKHEKQQGRNLAIPIPVIIALSLYKQRHGIPTKKAVYMMFQFECSYKTMVVNMNRFSPLAALILMAIMKSNQNFQHIVKHTDSTDLPVCSTRKAKYHKTMKECASWGKTGKGWFYGLKLHITTDLEERLLTLKFTTGNTDDREVFMEMNSDLDGLFIVDAGYISTKMAEDFHVEGKRYVLAKPRANMKKMATWLQTILYDTRMIIELNFRNLKCFYNLVTSMPRSVNGYAGNYIYSLLAYVLSKDLLNVPELVSPDTLG